mmetsp:Transcript_82489/g.229996  ORF Transcript_82489/g.229996 Transcript_82489/m.229996 type:complete len:312 (-) Transcript_82489:57-992(-)
MAADLVCQPCGEAEGELEVLREFQTFDSENTGVIDLRALKALFSDLSDGRMTSDDVDRLVYAFCPPVNDAGHVSLKDFLAALFPEGEAGRRGREPPEIREGPRPWLSTPVMIDVGRVDLETLDVARLVNSTSHQTKVAVPESETQNFNQVWCSQLLQQFRDTLGGHPQLQEFLETGQSNGRPLRLQVMLLPPNTWLPVHSHTNIEFMHCLAGELHEVRLENALLTNADEDLRELHKSRARAGAEPLLWKVNTMSTGSFMANAVYSVHQSFTRDAGAALLLLWSGCHANIEASRCTGLCEHFRPLAGSSTTS